MKTYYVVGSYSHTDSFAEPIEVFGGFNIKSAKEYLFFNFQVPINENKPSAKSFEHRTLEEVIYSPVVTDGFDFWGLFKVRANNEDEAKMIRLEVNENQIV